MKKRFFVLLLSLILVFNSSLPDMLSVHADASGDSAAVTDVSGADLEAADGLSVSGADLVSEQSVSGADVVDSAGADESMSDPDVIFSETETTDVSGADIVDAIVDENIVFGACEFCGEITRHLMGCDYYYPDVTFGKNPTYQGVGPLKESKGFDFSQIAMFTLDAGLAEMAEENGNKVTITTPDGAVSGIKEVSDTGNKNASGDPIFKIDLTASAVSNTTGESCDFVLVLDMSYSMTGDNLVALKEACKTFVNDLYDMARYSRVAIVTYGGDKHANQYYLSPYKNTENKTNAVLTRYADDDAVLHAKLSADTNTIKMIDQQWYIYHHKDNDKYVNLINMGNGEALDIRDGKVTEGQSTDVRTHPVNHSDAQKWRLIQNKDGSYTLEAKVVDTSNGRKFNLDYASGQTADGTNVIVWKSDTTSYTYTQNNTQITVTEASTPQKWFLTKVYDEPSYETYYWTSSENETGYEYRTDDTAADTSLLLVSEDDGKRVNSKLIAAIDALEVYGEAHEGSHPGEAMEKATRIFQAVRIDDENDFCSATAEYYYNSKRGVLYFADGAPSPVDVSSTSLYNYPGSNIEAFRTYGVEYDFEANYRDVQDALNWGKVLKADKGVNISATADGYDNDGKEQKDKSAFDMYYIDSKGKHDYEEYLDIGSSDDTPKVTGCGATVYVLSINLATIDVTLSNGVCDRSSHYIKGANNQYITTAEHKIVTVKTEDGTEKQICLNAVNDPNFFFDSFDSRSNEYFYRLSSHRKDSSHVSFGAPSGVRTEAQEIWHKAFTGTYTNKTHGWSGRYPDFLCRNQESSYFVACDDQGAIKEAFKGVALQTAKQLKNLTMTDNITQSFVISDINGNPVKVGTRILLDGTVLKDDESTPEGVLVGIVAENSEGNQCIVWKGFDLNPGDGQGAGSKIFNADFYLVPKDGFLGGNNVPTNDGAELAGPDDKPIIKYPDPDVNVDVSVDKVGDITLEARAGAVFLNEISYDQLLKLITIKVSETGSTEPTMTLKPSEDNYGLETWQNDYVNIKIALYDTQVDADGNQLYDDNGMPIPSAEITAGGKLSEIRRKREVIVQVWVWPKTYENGELEPTEPPKDAQTASGVCKIEVYYPTFVFSDVTLYHGQPLKLATEVWGEKMDATPYLYWYTNEEYETLLSNPEAKPRSDEYPKGYAPLPEGSFGKGEDVVADDEVPEVYFKVDPIDATITELDHKTGPVDEDFYSKFGDYMGKEQIAMNVRVFFTNEDDTGAYDPDDPTGTAEAMRNAFFLHTAIKTVSAVPKHTSGSSNSKDVYWGPEFFINPAYCELTINKTGGLPDETYVFTIARGLTTEKLKDGTVIQEETEPTYYTTVSITTDGEGKGSVKLTELPVGVYTVTEDLEWSWRYKESTPTLSWEYEDGTDGSGTKIYLRGNAAEDAAVVNVANSNPTKRWFNGVSDVVKNIFGKKGQ